MINPYAALSVKNNYRSSLFENIEQAKKDFLSNKISADQYSSLVDVYAYMVFLLDSGKISFLKKGLFIHERI